MDPYVKTILVTVPLLHLISYSFGQRPYHRPYGNPVACGSILEVTPQTQFTISSQMMTNFRNHVVDRNPFKNVGIGRYMKSKAMVESRRQIPLDAPLPPRSFPSNEAPADNDESKTGKSVWRTSSFLSRNNLNPPPDASRQFPSKFLQPPTPTHDPIPNINSQPQRKEPKENAIPDFPSPDNYNDDDTAYFPRQGRPQRDAPPPPPSPISSAPRVTRHLNLFNNADTLNSMNNNNNNQAAKLPVSSPHSDSIKNDKIERILNTPEPEPKAPKPKPRFNLDDIFKGRKTGEYKSPYSYLLKKNQDDSEEEDMVPQPTPTLTPSKPSPPFLSRFRTSTRDNFEDLKVKAEPSVPSFVTSTTPKPTPSPKKEEPSGSNLPPYIQRLLQAKKTKNPLSRPSSSARQPFPTRESQSVDSNTAANPQDILQSLGPEKIEQLRQLLNSAAGPYGPTLKEGSNTELLRTFSDQRHRFRSRRRRDIGQNFGEPDKCTATFKKGQGCEKLIVRIQHWIDETRDCNQEYLLIQDDQQLDRLCGSNDNNHPVRIVGNKVTVEHFLRSPVGKINFAGIVECES